MHAAEQLPALDLRVDAHADAVTELRRILDLWAQVDEYYGSRSEQPGSTPPQDVWMRERGLG